MNFKILESNFGGRKFIIEEDMPEVGVYLYIFEDGVCVKDYLQDNIDTCKKIAFEEYGVDLESWVSNLA